MTRTPAFGLDRFHVAEAPELLHVSAGKSLNLDDAEWQERIIATARAEGYRLVVLDSLRSVTEAADQGKDCVLRRVAVRATRIIAKTGGNLEEPAREWPIKKKR